MKKNVKNNESTKIFVNLPVKNLKKTMAFFSKVGFKFNPQFTDENAACMIISEDIFAMLLVKKFFKSFTKKKIIDAKTNTEAIISLSAKSRDKVDEIIKNAVKAGGKIPRPSADYGWMYQRSFQDIDGHLWEIIYMDMKALGNKMPQDMPNMKMKRSRK